MTWLPGVPEIPPSGLTVMWPELFLAPEGMRRGGVFVVPGRGVRAPAVRTAVAVLSGAFLWLREQRALELTAVHRDRLIGPSTLVEVVPRVAVLDRPVCGLEPALLQAAVTSDRRSLDRVVWNWLGRYSSNPSVDVLKSAMRMASAGAFVVAVPGTGFLNKRPVPHRDTFAGDAEAQLRLRPDAEACAVWVAALSAREPELVRLVTGAVKRGIDRRVAGE